MSSSVEDRSSKAEAEAKRLVDEPRALDEMAQKAEQKVRSSGGRLGAVKRDLQTMIRMLRAWASGKYKGMSVTSIVIVAGAVVYFLNPIDAIADFLPFIGFSDDVAVIAFAINRLRGEFEKFEDWEQNVDIASK